MMIWKAAYRNWLGGLIRQPSTTLPSLRLRLDSPMLYVSRLAYITSQEEEAKPRGSGKGGKRVESQLAEQRAECVLLWELQRRCDRESGKCERVEKGDGAFEEDGALRSSLD